jgi:hypothetical protein
MQIILNLSRNYLTDCGEDGKANRRLPRAIVVGTRARYGVVDTADMEEMVGILIEPGGFGELFRCSLSTARYSDECRFGEVWNVK